VLEEITASSLVKVAQADQVTKGLGGTLVWPGLLRKLDRRDASFRDQQIRQANQAFQLR
jgi:hypothetical protein